MSSGRRMALSGSDDPLVNERLDKRQRGAPATGPVLTQIFM